MENKSKPTRYIIQHKILLDNKYIILDGDGETQYTVNSTPLTSDDKLILYDVDGNELIKIRQEYLHFHPTYVINSVRHDADEMQLATIKQTGVPWNHKLEIKATNGEYLFQKNGGVLSHEFVLTKDGVMVATVTIDISPPLSTYYVNIANDREEYRPLLIAMVIVLACAPG